MKRILLLLTFSASLSLLLLEAGLRVGVKLGLFQFRLPSHSLIQARNPSFVRDVNPDFGVWHTPKGVSEFFARPMESLNKSPD